MVKKILLSLVLAFSCLANTETIQFTGPTTGASNGSVAVGPYNLIIDGIATTGVCITFDVDITAGQIWQAETKTVTDFSNSQTLLEAEYLIQQFATSTDWVYIHQAIWDTQEPGTFTDNITLAWLSQAQTNYIFVNPNSFSIQVPVPTNASQFFITQNDPPIGKVPEITPFSLITFGGFCISLGVFIRKLRKA